MSRNMKYITTKFKGVDAQLTQKIADWVNANNVSDVTMCYSQYEHDLIVGGYTHIEKTEADKKDDN